QPTARSVQVFGVHATLASPVPVPPLFAPPPPQNAGATHVPHWMTFPHPSPWGPQSAPRSLHVLGTQPVELSTKSEGLTSSVAEPPSPAFSFAPSLPHASR